MIRFILSVVFSAIAMLAAGGQVAAQDFKIDYVDPVRLQAYDAFSLAQSIHGDVKDRHDATVSYLLQLEASLNEIGGQMPQEDYDYAVAYLVSTADSLTISAGLVGAADDALAAAEVLLWLSDAAYDDEDFESSYVFANEAFTGLDLIVDSDAITIYVDMPVYYLQSVAEILAWYQ